MKTYQATVYCSLVRQNPQRFFSLLDIFNICQKFTRKWGIGVTVTKTNFVYYDDIEPGVAVGFTNCPRLHGTNRIDIRNLAIELAEILKQKLKQDHVIVVLTDETIKI